MSLKFTWEDGALALLEGRDRFTRKMIREEFREANVDQAIEFDPVEHGYVTPVSNGRYSVVWYLDQERHQGVVRAVVPWTGVNTSAAGLKAYVEKAMDSAFKRANVG